MKNSKLIIPLFLLIAIVILLIFCSTDNGNKNGDYMLGIDVSAYQGKIDWEKVADEGVEFAFIRLGYRGYTEGVLQMDKSFDENVKGALENGIEVGVYFVTQAVSEQEAAEEAEYVLGAIESYDIKWPIAYDIEGNKNPIARANENSTEQNTANVIAFCERIKKADLVPIVYSNNKWFSTKLYTSRLKEYELWYAYYSDERPDDFEHTIWQCSNQGQIAGINTKVDINKAYKDYGE